MVDTQLRVYNHPGRSIMARKRRTYTPEFKAGAVKLVTEQGYSVAEAARSLGIHETLLRSWKQALETQGDQALPLSPPHFCNSTATSAHNFRHSARSASGSFSSAAASRRLARLPSFCQPRKAFFRAAWASGLPPWVCLVQRARSARSHSRACL